MGMFQYMNGHIMNMPFFIWLQLTWRLCMQHVPLTPVQEVTHFSIGKLNSWSVFFLDKETVCHAKSPAITHMTSMTAPWDKWLFSTQSQDKHTYLHLFLLRSAWQRHKDFICTPLIKSGHTFTCIVFPDCWQKKRMGQMAWCFIVVIGKWY